MYEHSAPLDDNYASGPGLPPAGSTNLRKAGKWGRFIGIVSMASIGFLLLMLVLFSGTIISTMDADPFGSAQGLAQWMAPMLVFYGLFFALFLYLAYLLYSFGSNAMTAVDRSDEQAITASFGALARLFKIMGVLTVIQLCFYALWIVFFLVSGAAAFLG